MVSQNFIEEQQQILRLTTPRLKSTPGAPFAQDDKQKQVQKRKQAFDYAQMG
jgi:hypothetical protein